MCLATVLVEGCISKAIYWDVIQENLYRISMNGVRNTHFHQHSGQTHAYRNISCLVAFLYSFRVDTSFKVLKHTPLQHLPAILIINVIYTFPILFNHLYITLGNRPRPLMCCIKSWDIFRKTCIDFCSKFTTLLHYLCCLQLPNLEV